MSTRMIACHASIWPLTVLYDGACPLCSAEIHNLKLRNTQGLLHFVDVSLPDFEVRNWLPEPFTRQHVLGLMHARAADGQVLVGVDVFCRCYEAVGLPQVSRWLRAPVLRTLARQLYPWVARHRHWVPRWLVHALFGTAARRAAQQAASRHCAISANDTHGEYGEHGACRMAE